MKHKLRTDNQSQTISCVISACEVELASRSCSLKKRHRFLCQLWLPWLLIEFHLKHWQKATARAFQHCTCRFFSMVWHALVLCWNYLSIKFITFTLQLNWYLKVMEKNIVYHSYNVAAVRDMRIASVSDADVWHFTTKLYLRVLVLLNKLYLCSHPLPHQTTRSRDRLGSCREGEKCKMRPERMIPKQGKRMKEQCHDAKP